MITSRVSRRIGLAALVIVTLVTAAIPALGQAASAADPCNPVVSVIACENSKPGTPESVWQISGSGDPSIQGFATDMSVNAGGTESFKIDTSASAYALDIYRLGWYQGNGARLIASLAPSVPLPQTQPACGTIYSSAPAPVDCGNWAVSASWVVPSTAVSGVYIARLTRTDTGGASHIVFVVRNDGSHSDLLMQTSDTTWQAYNSYGGSSFYVPTTFNTQADKVSYNRPVLTRDIAGGRDFLFSNEYPMIRFLERNGYDVSYISGVDTARYGSLLLNHKVFLSVGHDEYWSGQARANVQAARDAGVSLAFFSGNEIYWKTRWEPSYDGTSTDYRTLVCYKETWADAKIDPTSAWTGTWRDPRFSPPADGGYPENAMSGTMFQSNSPAGVFTVPYPYSKARIWRNTAVAATPAGGSTSLLASALGYEFDTDADNGFRPAGLIDVSHTVASVAQKLIDYGSTVVPGTVTHSMTEYKAPSGALVFSAGTIQWAWGLDADHDGSSDPADPNMQQATVNVLADMGAQPATLASPGLVAASPTTDTTAPTAAITAPPSGSSVQQNGTVTISGTAADVGGIVAGVEVSTDGGASWHPATPSATGFSTWSYTWTPAVTGAATLEARATDDSLNIGTPATAAVSVVGPKACPCSLFTTSPIPFITAANDSNSVELGVTFSSSVNGYVTAVRFYKGGPANAGTHTGSLWSATGTLLATATFNNESTYGWQTVTFPSPVPITAGTTYVASYLAPQGSYSADVGLFASPFVNAPLTATGSAYVYGAGGGFPATASTANYWVDPVFTYTTVAPTVTGSTPADGATGVATSVTPSVTFSQPVQAGVGTFAVTVSGGGAAVTGTMALDTAGTQLTFTPSAPLAAGTSYTATVSDVLNLDGAALATRFTFSFTTAASTGGGGGGGGTATPTVTVDRLFGPDRYGTSAAISADGFAPGVPVAFVATGEDFPDALAGAAAAGSLGGPVLLVQKLAIPTSVMDELRRLQPAQIVVVGGSGVISDQVATVLKLYTAGTVTRVSGANRYATAAALSQKYFSAGLGDVLVATGTNYPDALSGAAAAGANKVPVLLVTASGIPAETVAELQRLKPTRITILGGIGAVSATVANALAAYAPQVRRLAGADRYSTAVAVSQAYFSSASRVLVASGAGFADALSGAARAAALTGPILLSASTCLPAVDVTEISRLAASRVTLLGGTGALSSAVEALTPCVG